MPNNRHCWLSKVGDICYVHLGKYGDVMLFLPALKRVADETGKPPIVMISRDYASVLEGVSYVRPWVVDLHWWQGLDTARKMAEAEGFRPHMTKWWDLPDAKPPMDLPGGRNITLTVHGRAMTIAASEWDSFQASQWRYAGFTVENMMQWPLVFDRRSPEREEQLRQRHMSGGHSWLLVNMPKSGTSVFQHQQRAMALAQQSGLMVCDLSMVHATRIYDLLGLYDHAVGMVTADTATLHLAPASNIPYIAFVNDGGAGSIPRGNCILSIRYSQFPRKIPAYINALKSLRQEVAA